MLPTQIEQDGVGEPVMAILEQPPPRVPVDARASTTQRSLLVPIIAAVAFPPVGLVALTSAVIYRRSVRAGKPSTRHAVRAREWSMYAFSAALTAAVICAAVGFLLVNNHKVLHTYFDTKTFREDMPDILRAFKSNLSVSVVAEAGTIVWALVLAITRGLPGKAYAPMRFLAVAYIDLFRGLPALLTILLIGFGLPATGVKPFATMSLFEAGATALIMVYGAYVAEIFRAGIEAIPAGQMAAARSLGLGYFQAMRYIILPQAIRQTLPSLLSWYISILKDTALLSILGLLEALNVGRIQVTNSSNLTPLVGVSLCFLLITLPLSRATDLLIRHEARKRAGGN
jgi:polar amino acid transport system permease protein